MKKLFFLIIALLVIVNAFAFKSEMKSVKLSDGEIVEARLCLPDSMDVGTIVVVVHGSGPSTYLNKRSGFNYYDVLAEGFCEQGVGFYTYDRRGCTVGNEPPLFTTIDSLQYRKYTPQQDALDVESHVAALTKDKRFRHYKILLYGISEGTIVAPMVAERGKVKVDGLLLHGYVNDSMYDIVCWQNEGNSSMIALNLLFDKDGDDAISREEYEDPDFAAYRTAMFNDTAFDLLDAVINGFFDINDIRLGRNQIGYHEIRMNKIAEGDEGWIEKNYSSILPLTIPWFRAHFATEANKTRLLRLTLPIHIFHGTHDANVPVEGVSDIAERFRVCEKTNLTTHIFEKHNHDLNFHDWISTKKYPDGLQKIFEISAEL